MDPQQESLTLALLLQAILYGVYLSSGGYCLRSILYDDEGRRKSRRNTRWTVFIALLVLLLSSTDLGISLYITLAAVSGRDTTNNLINLVNITIKGLVMLITDGILIYRCSELYSHPWRMIYILFALWVACFTGLIGRVGGMAILERDTLAVLFLSCNVATTAWASIAIVHRTLWPSGTTNMRKLGHPLRNTSVRCWTFVETGTLYTLTSSSALVVAAIYDPQVPLLLVLDAVNFSIAAITFNAVLATINQQRDERYDTASMRGMESELEMTRGSWVPRTTLTDEYAKHVSLVLFM